MYNEYISQYQRIDISLKSSNHSSFQEELMYTNLLMTFSGHIYIYIYIYIYSLPSLFLSVLIL